MSRRGILTDQEARCIMYSMLKTSKEKTISSIRLFSTLSRKDLHAVSRLMDMVSVESGTKIVKEGTFGREVYFIISGVAGVYKDGERVATLESGNHFGELSAIDHKPRNATVISDSAMELAIIGLREFNGLIDSIPEISNRLLSSLATRARRLATL